MGRNTKCILVNPPTGVVNISAEEGIREAVEQAGSYPPIGLAYIAAVLRENGVEVKIVDAKALKLSHEETARMIAEEKPGLVGVTVFTTQFRSALTMCHQIKRTYPETKIVVGGPHVNPLHEEMIKQEGIDFCVRGEGETTMLELVDATSNGWNLKGVKGLTFKEGNEVYVNEDRPFIEDLDSLPFPARDLLPSHLYRGSIGLREGKFTIVTASRGCPFKCHFCSTPQYWPVYRRRSVGNVLDELEYLHTTYKLELVRFTDEALLVNKKWITQLCQGMVDRGLNREIEWTCDGRVDIVSQDILEAMGRANCRLIFYGIEFGNQRILDFSGKGTTLAQIHKAVEMTRRAGISPVGNFMLGYPTETRETIEDTIALARSLDIDHPSFSIVTPFPGTQLYQYCKENNLLRTDNWDEYNYIHPQRGVIKLRDVTDDELMSLYDKARSEFYYKQISRVWLALGRS